MAKNKKFECDECFRDDFKSERGVWQHKMKAHPYVPPPAPAKTTETAPGEEFEQTLIGGSHLNIGDLVWFGRKCVITKLTRTEGSKDIFVTLKVTKKWYSTTEIS
jgi:hypothetical protein